MRGVVALAIVGAAGCNQAFGLDQTTFGIPCWDEAASEFDEDADGIVDGCDICPAVANAKQRDSDGDGVGDDCDPHPDAKGDAIAFFEGFNLPTLDSRWRRYGTAGLANWETADGVVAQTVTNGTGALVLHETFVNASLELVMSGQAQTDPAVSSTMGGIVGIPPEQESGFPPALYCFIYEAPSSPTDRRLVKIEVNPGGDPRAEVELAQAERTLLRFDTTGVCLGAIADGLAARPAITPELAPVSGEVALRMGGTVGTYHSVTVYTTAL